MEKGGRGQGRLICILGPMFSGKTTELIRLHDRYQIAQKKCVLVKYAGDTRYDKNLIVTHKKTTAQGCTLVAKRLAEVVSTLFSKETEVIAIDEGQFFDDLSFTCDELTQIGKIVIVAALDGTFMRKPFSEVTLLLPYCDEIKKLVAVCMICGEDAPFTFRNSNDTEVEKIGGAEVYCALCRLCYQMCSLKKRGQRSSIQG